LSHIISRRFVFAGDFSYVVNAAAAIRDVAEMRRLNKPAGAMLDALS
jgi:hypothetical protein